MAAEKKKAAPTEYVVLRKVDNDPPTKPLFEIVGGTAGGKPKTFVGTNTKSIIKEAVKGDGNKGGTFTLVPVRSFKLVSYEVVKEPVEKFGEATL